MKTPEYWRSLSEYENDPEFLEYVQHEFATPLEDTPPGSPERRRFLQLMGASFAFAGATGCRYEEDKLLPHSRRPEGVTPGVPQFYNTAMELGGVGVGIRVKSFDGRPIKVEGNPQHPASLGAAGVYEQASILELYDPDRSSAPRRGGESVEWIDFRKFAKDHFAKLRQAQGRGLRILTSETSSVSFHDMKARFSSVYPLAKWVVYEPISDENQRRGSELAFGGVYRPQVRLERADVIVSLDSDFLGSARNMRLIRQFAARRLPETGEMNRLYAVESSFSATGGMADNRLSLRAELIKAFTVALDAELSQQLNPPEELGAAQARPNATFLKDAKVKKFLTAMAKDLARSAGRSVVVAGDHQPPEVHALVARINAVLGNAGRTVSYVMVPHAARASSSLSLAELVEEMSGGAVDTLLILESNPVYDAPGDLNFAGALGSVKTSVHLSLYDNETSRASSWHLPQAHFLEVWGDVRAQDGTITVQQPLIAPLYGGVSPIEFMALLLPGEPRKGLEIVKRALSPFVNDERLWRKAVHDGVVMGSRLSPMQPELRPLQPLPLSERELSGLTLQNGELELQLAHDGKVYDGRFANSGWLQELPETTTKLTWDNAAWINPETARELGIRETTLASLNVGSESITAPVLFVPGQARGSVRIALGYGRTQAGRVGGATEGDFTAPSVGVNAYKLRSKERWHFGGGLSVTSSGRKYRLATTQDKHAIDQIGREGAERRLGAIVREATLDEYKQQPDFARHALHHPPLLSLWREPVSYEGRRWGMNVDLNKCTGCNACVIACQAENNIPVVGKDRVLMGREMSWMRIDRYFKGDTDQPQLVNQPVMCQQCEHAPCEQVCPVGATVHSSEGLNDMTYNRCIGTRYCSNNCPYKVRRFNYFNFHEDLKDERNKVKGMAFNPEVTVRFRGVMEKCTYCVQRIQAAKIEAKNHQQELKDGNVVTACQQTCPTGAIVFGDLADRESAVSKAASRPRSYALLEQLNVRPRTTYQARVRNPNPELV